MTDLFSADALSALLSAEALTAFLQVIMIDLVLAGDNAIVIGLAAAGLPKDQRGKAILVGIIAATVLRILFASVTVQLLQIIGLLLAGGVLLLWVCWKMWRELRTPPHDIEAAEHALEGDEASAANGAPRKTLGQAIWQITLADVSMSLDNVLAVAGAAREHPDHPDLRPRPVDRADGPGRDLHRQAAAEASLDRLCRPRHHSLCRARHVLPRRARGLAARLSADAVPSIFMKH